MNKLNKIHLRTCIGVEYDLPLISYFIEHYKGLGVKDFYITLSSPSKDHENLGLAITLLKKYKIKPFDVWIGPYREHLRGNYLNEMIKHLSDEEWVLTADCDEFQEYPIELNKFINELEEQKATWVEGGVVDRVTKTGAIPEKLNPNLSLFEQFPAKCNIHRLKEDPKGGVIINGEKFMPKVVLHKKRIKLSTGNHIILNKREKKYNKVLEVGHFKWFGRAYEKIVQIKKDDITNNAGKDGQINHLRKYKKINLQIVGL